MKKFDPQAKYFETNDWARKDNDGITIGITDFAQVVFGDVVLVEFGKVGNLIQKGEQYAIIESNKSSTELFSPLSGKIIAINLNLENQPELLNSSPYQNGWLIKLESIIPSEWEELMDAKSYNQYMKIFYNKM